MTSMTTRATHTDHAPNGSECWCCGMVDEPRRMIHLGNHPEVALCVRCGYWAAKRAGEVEDRDKSGPLVIARDAFRSLRRSVITRGWQHNRVVGGLLRWVGKRLP